MKDIILIIESAILAFLLARNMFHSSNNSDMLGCSKVPYYKESDDNIAKFKQECEDNQINYSINREASDRLDMWIEGRNGVVIFNPLRFSYTIHHEPTAKYLHADFNKLVQEKYLELKKEYEKI